MPRLRLTPAKPRGRTGGGSPSPGGAATPAGTTPAGTGHLAAIRDQMRSGVPPAEIASRLGLPRDVVDAMVDHWVRVGGIVLTELRTGCPSSGCGGCSVAASGSASQCRSS